MQVGAQMLNNSLLTTLICLSMKLKIDEDSNNPDIVSSVTRNQVSLLKDCLAFLRFVEWSLFLMKKSFHLWLRRINRMVSIYRLEPGGIIPNYSVEMPMPMYSSWYHRS